jgi:hypothetical protein
MATHTVYQEGFGRTKELAFFSARMQDHNLRTKTKLVSIRSKNAYATAQKRVDEFEEEELGCIKIEEGRFLFFGWVHV